MTYPGQSLSFLLLHAGLGVVGHMVSPQVTLIPDQHNRNLLLRSFLQRSSSQSLSSTRSPVIFV